MVQLRFRLLNINKRRWKALSKLTFKISILYILCVDFWGAKSCNKRKKNTLKEMTS